jgi:hypothetical protein
LAVTTNAAGRAAAAGLTPTGSGALQIGASATFQGQTAVATIVQTNVMTAAQAAAVSAGGASSSASAGAGGAAAGGSTGGGLSASTIGIIGGAAGGSIVAARQLIHGTIFSGPFGGTLLMMFPCTRPEILNGTLEFELDDFNGDAGEIRGTWKAEGQFTTATGTCNNPPEDAEMMNPGTGSLSGSPALITFSGVNAGDNPPPDVNTWMYSFAGTLAGDEISGQFTVTREVGFPAGDPRNGVGTVTQSVTLRKK